MNEDRTRKKTSLKPASIRWNVSKFGAS